MIEKVETKIGKGNLIIETGRMAKQADGAACVFYGDTAVLVTAVASTAIREGIDFLPLTVDYREKTYAAGKIPGGFFKREGRPSEKETLTSRLIDRPLRPLFPEGYYNETQIMATVISHDQDNDPDVLSIIGASTALALSQIPFTKIVGAVRVGRINGEFVANPSYNDLEQSDIDLVIAGTKNAIMMVEGGAKEVDEETMIAALEFGHQMLKDTIAIQEELVARCGKFKVPAPQILMDPAIVSQITSLASTKLTEIFRITDKLKRQQETELLFQSVLKQVPDATEQQVAQATTAFQELERRLLRDMVLKQSLRADGRGLKDVRPITIEVGLLPRVHGSALFTRGETQALVATTLGTSTDEQIMDELFGEYKKTFMLHYNFPPFSVGEVKPIRGPGRREIGHGKLAERSLASMMPSGDEFPYTIRVVSDILESNGSSSMATVCGATLSLMDAGVPIKAPVAGIAMGLVQEGSTAVILSDILGIEDHLGDMDFKVAGSKKGITGFQLDIKTEGLDLGVLGRALEQAREGRLFILEKMLGAIAQPRAEISRHAPKIIHMRIEPEKIRDVIGPGGRIIRGIVSETGAEINVEDDGRVLIAAVNPEAGEKAYNMIRALVEDVEVGKIYTGTVKRVLKFGAFVEILPGKEGLVHISELSDQRVRRVEDVLKEGDTVTVKCIEIDRQNRINLSKRAADIELGVKA
ncbi:MAG: polyribonucleotide nucleotidyltransferase [Candidatus Abyssobacteria bacterium SURF_17]|uniref:Polyribonucleotide nucleotidyltransferase n=1 Tax=Candidatus Abyssobacteria bacterium SURF_17 TaxID=2093361 RepID=A0A419ETT8_9BACT|nr:MAG: polyribonucleotide nucleotidyltransferase [Candidatus Abyssubacteria bacterium SURF_17]